MSEMTKRHREKKGRPANRKEEQSRRGRRFNLTSSSSRLSW